MKKALFTLLAFICVNFNLLAQNLEQDITYYKMLNKLWTMSSSFDKVAFHLDNESVELEQTRLAELEVIAKLQHEARNDLNTLRIRNYSSLSYKKIEGMMTAMEKSLEDLRSETWTTDPMWQYGYSLVKISLSDLGTQKELIPHLSKNE